MRFTRELYLEESIRSYYHQSCNDTCRRRLVDSFCRLGHATWSRVILSREAEAKIGPGISVMLANWNLYDRKKIVPLEINQYETSSQHPLANPQLCLLSF